MLRYPQTYRFLSVEKSGSWESDPALRLLPALHVFPSMCPSMCTQKIKRFCSLATFFASSSEVCHLISWLSKCTCRPASSPLIMDPAKLLCIAVALARARSSPRRLIADFHRREISFAICLCPDPRRSKRLQSLAAIIFQNDFCRRGMFL